MKTFNASDLSKKPSQVWASARHDGAFIQHKDRQGNVVEEFIINKIPSDLSQVYEFNSIDKFKPLDFK